MNLEQKREFIINSVYYAIIAIIVILLLQYVVPVLMPFIVGFVIALLLKKPVELLTRKLKIDRKWSSIFMLIVFYGIIGALLFFLSLKLFVSIQDLFTQFPQIFTESIEPAIRSMVEWISTTFENLDPAVLDSIVSFTKNFSSTLMDFVTTISTKSIGWISGFAMSIPSAFISFLFTVISSFFITIDYVKITSFFKTHGPDKLTKIAIAAQSNFFFTIWRFIRAYAILITITFVELSIGLSVLKVDNAIAVAALIAIIDILPVLGTGGVVIPWAIIELINGNAPLCIGLLVLYAIITVIRNILEPKVVGDQIGLYPLVTLMCMFVGGSYLGVLGLFGLPILVTVIKNLNDKGVIEIFKKKESLENGE